MRVAVIGGAGFIGGHLVDALLEAGHQVRILDNLDPQVHPSGKAPDYLNARAEFLKQDIRDVDALRTGLASAEAVYYLAGAVGVGDSMYCIRRYTDVNLLGCANLLEILASSKHSVRKLILSSSVTVYGEGKYASLAPPALKVSPDWLPISRYPGYAKSASIEHGSYLAAASLSQSTPIVLGEDGRSWTLGCGCGLL